MTSHQPHRPQQRPSKSISASASATNMTTPQPPPYPRHTTTAAAPKLILRFPKHIWNAYTPSSSSTPTPIPIPIPSSLSSRKPKPKPKPPAPSPKSAPKRCSFRPGRAFHYGPHSVTYEAPCLRETCANCRRWYGGSGLVVAEEQEDGEDEERRKRKKIRKLEGKEKRTRRPNQRTGTPTLTLRLRYQQPRSTQPAKRKVSE